MLGREVFSPKLFYRFSLEAQVPGTTCCGTWRGGGFRLLRRLTARFCRTGRPGLDPVVLFKLSLSGFLYGITSERRLAAEVRLHLAYRSSWGTTWTRRRRASSVLSEAQGALRACRVSGLLRRDGGSASAARAGLVHGDVLSRTARWSRRTRASGRRGRGASSPDSQHRRLRRGDGAARTLLPARRRFRPVTDGRAWGDAGAERRRGRTADRRSRQAAAARRRPGRRAQRAPGDGQRPGAHSHRPRRRAGTSRGISLASLQGDVGVDGGRRASSPRVEVPGEVADEHLLDRLLKEHAATTGRTLAEVVADTKYGTPAPTRGARGAGDPGEHPVSQRRARARRLRGRPLGLRGQGRRLPVTDRPTAHPLRRFAHGRPDPAASSTAAARRCVGPARSGHGAAQGQAAATIIRPNDQALRDRVAAYLRTRAAKRHLRRAHPGSDRQR